MANRVQLGRVYHFMLPIRDMLDVTIEMAQEYILSEETQALIIDASKAVQRAVNACRHEYWMYDNDVDKEDDK